MRDGAFQPKARTEHRALAFQLLYSIDRGDYQDLLTTVLANYSEVFGLTSTEKDFFFELVAGVLEKKEELDATVEPFLENWTLDRISCSSKLFLRMAIFELETVRTPLEIVINEYVNLSKLYCERGAFKFINAVIDRYSKKL